MLDLQEYQLYGRQMILSGFGLPGQTQTFTTFNILIVNNQGNLNCGRRLLQLSGPGGWAALPFNT